MQVKDKQSVELNYLQLVQGIFADKRNLLYFTLGGLFLGILIAFTAPKEYTSTSVVILEESANAGQLGQMGALAGLAGISLPQMQGEQATLTAELFPDIIHSRDFLMGIAKKPFYFQSKEKEMSLEEYYLEEKPGNIVKKTLGFIFSIPARIVGIFSSEEFPVADTGAQEGEAGELPYVVVSSSEIFAVNLLKDQILIDEKTKMIELKVSMPEPIISAEVNGMVMKRLIDYVTDYKTAKQKMNMEFVQERVLEAQDRFQEAQLKLASFRDSNQGIISRRALTKEEQLEFEFNISYNIYNTLKQELEQATIQMKKETPIFTVMEKASIPLGPSKPNKPLILVISLFLGFLIGVLYNMYRVLLAQISN